MADILAPGRINLIDVCPSVQGKVDYKKVKEAGFRGVYIQSSRFSSTAELGFLRERDAAQLAGLAVGAYHYLSHDTDPAKQMAFFHRQCNGLGSAEGELPPMLDWEHCTPSKYVDHPRHCCRFLSNAANAATALFYPDNHLRTFARRPVVYTYPNYAGGHQPVLSVEFGELDYYPLCYASYKSKPAASGKGYELVPWLPGATQHPLHPIPKPWTEWTLWQYSGNRGIKVPGVGPDCDRQVANMDEAGWRRFLGHSD